MRPSVRLKGQKPSSPRRRDPTWPPREAFGVARNGTPSSAAVFVRVISRAEIQTDAMSTREIEFRVPSEYVIDRTRQGAVEGAEAGAVFGPAGVAIGAGWGAAIGYVDGASRELSEQFLRVDYPSMTTTRVYRE